MIFAKYFTELAFRALITDPSKSVNLRTDEYQSSDILSLWRNPIKLC